MKKISSFIAIAILFITLSPTAFTFANNIVSTAIEEDACNEALQFSTNPSDFYKELADYLNKIKRSDVNKIAEEFIGNCKAGTISPDHVDQIILNCNTMLTKRMRITPHFSQYLAGMNALVGTGTFTQKFEGWHGIVSDMAASANKGKFNKFTHFTDFSINFFTGETLYKTSGKSWQMQSVDYNFSYDNKVPKVTIEDGSLLGMTLKDSVSVVATTGDYYPLEYKWKGQEGKVTWERVGLDPNQVYAEIGVYEIDLKQSRYAVEDAIFYHKEYFNRPLKGRLRDKLGAKISGQYMYPEFYSYELDIVMNNLAPQVEFISGFGLKGKTVIGFGDSLQRATVDFYSKDDRRIIRAKADRFVVKELSQINAKNTAVSLYFAEDSIYHPTVNLKYLMSDQELRLVRDNTSASAKIAFMSSFHKLEAKLDAIFWKINTPLVNFKMVSELETIPVSFESFESFSSKRLHDYRKTGENPLVRLYKFSSGGKQRKVNAEDFAKYMNPKYSARNITGTIFKMVEDGFIYYDSEKQEITVRDKLYHYLKADKGDVDFDRIIITSTTGDDNGQLNLDEKELLVTGVKKIALSDSQRVYLHPQKGLTRIYRNRDMKFDGGVVAGNVDFSGHDFKFDYNNFQIKLDSIDEMQIYLVDETHKRKTVAGNLYPINTAIRDITGLLLVDESDNKSGRKSKPEFPIFNSTGNAYVYYNSKKLFNGAYKKDTFYFKLDPFRITNLDEIQPDQLYFKGKMVAGNIFPEMEQALSLQPDNSLGFVNELSNEAVPSYGKGNFTGKVTMSNKGLIGEGKLEYLASTVLSDKFIFLPDSMLTVADSFYVTRSTIGDIEFPQVYNSDVKVKWLPSKDSLLVEMKENPFFIFENGVTFRGHLAVTANGMKGSGTMNWAEASIRSRHFRYTSATFLADSSDLVIKNEDAARVAFNSYNVRSKVNMDNMEGEFRANGKSIPIIFPYNMYKAEVKEFYWLMNDQLVNLRMPDDTVTYFESTHPQQGGLKFRASGGVVNLRDNTIEIDGIPYIKVADAKIRPEGTKLTLLQDAQFKTLENALMVMDTVNEQHRISDATITIKSINEFEGKGEYKYKGKKMKKQKIFFDMLMTKEVNEEEEAAEAERLAAEEAAKQAEAEGTEKAEGKDKKKKGKKDKKKKDKETKDKKDEKADKKAEEENKGGLIAAQEEEKGKKKKKRRKKDKVQKGQYYTYGVGSIGEKRKFKLSKRINFKGQAILDGRKPFLTFDGYANLKLKTKQIEDEWFYFTDQIDPNNVQIDVSTPIGERTDTLLFGVTQDMDSLVLYPSFLSKKRTPLDWKLFQTTGELEFDPEKNSYRVASQDKLEGKTFKGNILTFEDNDGKINGEGRFDLGTHGMVDVDAAGFFNADVFTNEFEFKDMVVGLDFMFDKKLLEKVGETIRSYNVDKDEVEYNTNAFTQPATQLVDDKKFEDFNNMIKSYGYVNQKIKGLDHTILLTHLNMVWDTTSRTLRSKGRFGVSFTGEKAVNRTTNGYVEFGIRRSGNFFNVYLEMDKDEVGQSMWYFFTYRKDKLQCISSDPEFNQKLGKIKEGKRRQKDDKRNLAYMYGLCPMAKRNDFVFRMIDAENPIQSNPNFDPNAPMPPDGDPNFDPNFDPNAPMPPQGDPNFDPNAPMPPQGDPNFDPNFDPNAPMPPEGDPSFDPNAPMPPQGDPNFDPNAPMPPDGDPNFDPNAPMPPQGDPNFDPNAPMPPEGDPNFDPNAPIPPEGDPNFDPNAPIPPEGDPNSGEGDE